MLVDEEMDGKNLVLLSRSPDCLALLNRLGINRIGDILKFQELIGAMRADIGSSHGPTLTSGGVSRSAKRYNTSRVTNNQSPAPVLDFQTSSPQGNVSSTYQPSSSDHQKQHHGAMSPNASSTASSSANPPSHYSTVYEGANDKTVTNWQ